MIKSYLCKKCLKLNKLDNLKQDAKKRKGIIKNLRQCPEDGCGSVVFYMCWDK